MKYYFDFNQRSVQISTFTLICEHPMKVKVRTIAPEKNCLPIPKLTLSQTLTLTGGGNFSRGQLSGCPPNPQTKPHLDPNPDPNRGQLSPGGNCPDTVKDLL